MFKASPKKLTALAASVTVAASALSAGVIPAQAVTAPIHSATTVTASKVTSTAGWTTTNVNLRTGPSTAYRSIGVVPQGEKITVYSSKSGNWTKVKTSKGTGWMSSSYITNRAPATVTSTAGWTTNNVNLRTGPSTAYRSIGVVPKGEKITVYSTSSGIWKRVKTSKGEGWMSSNLISSTAPVTVTSTAGWTTNNVNLRTGPSTAYRSIGVVPKGEKITVYSTSSGIWKRVKTSKGEGWMSSNLISSTAPVASAPSPAPAPAVKKVTNLTHTSYSAAGMTSTYSVRADGIDYSKPVGALFYFDGDYWGKSASISENPSGAKFKALAAEANRRNLIFIAPITPSANTRANGYTWWERVNPNGDWQRSLASAYLDLYPVIDRNRIHSMGYSGGAEFISGELMKDRPENWMKDGSSIIVAGGGHFNGGFSNGPSSTFRKNVDMRWYAGSRDVAGQTNPPTWSALNAAREGSAAYRNAGYNARLVTLDGLGHHDYVLHNIMAQHFNAIGVKRLR